MALEDELLERALPPIDDQSAVVLADYERGVITPQVSRTVIRRCRERGISCVVDPKKADFAAYPNFRSSVAATFKELLVFQYSG